MADPNTSHARWGIAPYFFVHDVVTSANYYRDKLGFTYNRFFGDPPEFCMVQRNGIVIMLKQIAGITIRPNHLAEQHGDSWDAYIWVDDADALYEHFKSNGVKIARPLCDQPYGCRDFDIEDPNGYRLCFGHDTQG